MGVVYKAQDTKLKRAIAMDSKCAMAWYGLASIYSTMGSFAYMPTKEANLLSQQAMLKALGIDDTLPQAHAAKALARANAFDWKGAEQEFLQAIKSEPESSNAWVDYEYNYLVPIGRLDEAIASSRRAVELDPLSPFAQWRLGHRYYLARQWDRAIEQFHSALELDPQYVGAYAYLGIAYIQIGKTEEGIRAIEKAAPLMGRSQLALGFLAWAYARTGRIGEARKLLAEVQQLAKKTDVLASALVLLYAGLGETDKSLDWLEKAMDERELWIFTLNVELLYDVLRSHPRYRALLRKMNLSHDF